MSVSAGGTSAAFPYQNILIIKPGAIGDLLQLTPLIRALKQASPSCAITVLVGNEASREIFRNNPNVSGTLVFDRKGRHKTLPALLKLWQDIRANRFDLVLNFQRSNLKAWLLAFAALPCRILVYHKARSRAVHAVRNYLETIAPLGVATDDLHLEYFPDARAQADANALLASQASTAGPLVALNPGASHPVNRWPAQRFAELADLLAHHAGAPVIIVGGKDDIPLADEIIENSSSKPHSFAGKTAIPVLGALLQRCAVLVSGDTGPLHMATAVGTPVIALFGAADPLRTGPVGPGHRVIRANTVACVPCRRRSCSHIQYIACMEAISASRVFEEVASLLHPGSTRP